ncbi:NTPase KAP [Vibrio jasicida]|uniref:KAP family P-loop NTPase fold protein n=1 Tax=Vibrio jasicida TaxID=766224 RepID=UPI002895F340|nr:NTPase KAP [Vibrio jasicida]
MPQQLVINWDEPASISGQHFPEDKLNRAKYAEFLTKFLSTQGFDEAREEGEQKRNYVLNLNSEWGSGKTYFLKRWANDLKEHYPVVYVDAWEKDYSEDPLMTVVSAIIKDLKAQAGRDEEKFTAPTKLIGLLKAAAPGIARGMSKRFLGIDPVIIMEAGERENGAIESITVPSDNGESIDLSHAGSDVVKHLIREHEAKSEAISNLKKNVAQWVEAVKALKSISFPAFIFIDELDRCRPSYAVEMLETIKHIFDIPGVVFVVATDTEQLQHAVKAVYGEGFDARVYLGRFFNSRFSLKAPSLENFLDAHSDSYKLATSYLNDLGIKLLPFTQGEKETLQNISVVLNAFRMSPRTSLQIADRVIATISHMPKNSSLDILMLTTLHCLRERNEGLFKDIVSGGFKRVEGTGDSSKVIYLSSFLESSMSLIDGIIATYLEPSSIASRLRLSSHQTYGNFYKDGIYNFTYQEYLRDVFAPHFESIEHTPAYVFGLSGTSRSPTQTSLEKCAKRLKELHEDSEIESAGIEWMKYIYLNDRYDSISKEQYQDFVELSSALDWMGKEEL